MVRKSGAVRFPKSGNPAWAILDCGGSFRQAGQLLQGVRKRARGTPFPQRIAHKTRRFGSGCVSIGLTFHYGSLPSPVVEPPADYVQAVLGAVGLETYLLQVHCT